MTSWTKEVCSCSLMNIEDKSSSSKLAPVGMAAAISSPKGKPAITLAVPSVCLPAPITALSSLPPCPPLMEQVYSRLLLCYAQLEKKFQSFLSSAVSEARALSVIALQNKMEKRVLVERQDKEHSTSAIKIWEKESSDSPSTTDL